MPSRMSRAWSRITGQDSTIKQEAKPVEKMQTANTLLGGFFEFGSTKLSNEKTISHKLLDANREWVYKNNDVIAKRVSTIEFKLFKVKFVNGEFEFEVIKQNPILDLLDRFNESTNKTDGIYVTQSHKKLTGDAFWFVEKINGMPDKVYPLEPDKVELKLGDFTKSGGSLIESYEYKTIIDGKKVTRTYAPDEIIHFKTPNPTNLFRGYGAVEALAETIDLENLSNDLQRKFFDNGAISNFMLSTDKNLTDEQIKRVKREFRAEHAGTRNAFKTLIMGGGLKPEVLRMTNKDMEFLSQLAWYRDKIMVGFGNTKASLGLIDDVNRASHESSINNWLDSTIKPDMESITNTLNEFLIPMFDGSEDLILGFEDPVPENKSAKYEKAKIFKETGVASRNEIREVLDLDQLDGEEHDAVPIPNNAIPAPLENVDLERVFRSRKLYDRLSEHRQIVKASRDVAKRLIKIKKVKKENVIEQEVEKPKEHVVYSNDEVWAFHDKQIEIVEVVEELFKNKIIQFINTVKEQVLENYPEKQPKQYKKQLFNEDELLVKAELDFAPLLMQVALQSGAEALKLIQSDEVYTPDMESIVRENIKLFTNSMLDTEKEKIAQIIAESVKQGRSIPNTRKLIEEEFDNLSRVQSERITRTEVIKASNQASIDAWEQSGVVVAKQWLTAEDDRVDPLCNAMNGKTIMLKEKYFKKGDEFMTTVFNYSDIKEPPLHPNCRCTLLPLTEDDFKGENKAIQAHNEKLIAENKKLLDFIEELQNE